MIEPRSAQTRSARGQGPGPARPPGPTRPSEQGLKPGEGPVEIPRRSATFVSAMQTVESITQRLTETLRAPVRVQLGRSRTRPVQAQALRPGVFSKSGVSLRLHRVFLEAPDEILQDMGQWLRSGRRARKACERLDRWIHEALEGLPPAPRRAAILRPQGTEHDLDALLQQVVAQEFPGSFAGPSTPHELPFGAPQGSPPPVPLPSITWGQGSTRKVTRSLRLGSFVSERNLIRIHPKLDRASVPDRFVRYIIFHELLHALFPSHKDPGRPLGAPFARVPPARGAISGL